MKKCPSCDKKFEDSMRFCQSDGTPLVDDAPPLDPYKTIVARPIDTSAEPAAASFAPSGQTPIAEPDDLLDLPDADPLKTMYVSEDEMRRAMGGGGSGELQIPSEPEPPKFIQNEVAPPVPEAPTTAVPSPFNPPSMFTDPAEPAPPEPQRPMFTEPPPSAPFGEPVPSASSYDESATVIQDFPPSSPFASPEPSFGGPSEPRFESAAPSEPAFKEPEPYRPAVIDTPSPFQQDNSPAVWTPPPPPDASWQNQEIGQNTPFQSPAAGLGGQSKGLAIGSLVCGILSMLCCVSVITGPIGIVLGYLARKKVAEDPANFGGEGLALAGMITGAVGFLIGFVLIVLQIFFGTLNALIR